MTAKEARQKTEDTIINIESKVEKKFNLFKDLIIHKILKATDIGDFYMSVDTLDYEEEESEVFQLIVEQNTKYDMKNHLESLGYHIKYYDESVIISWYKK